ncbi:MAG TPA: ParA family partition ATPase [Polyangiaceae bacterium]|jgi:chromosome partitioning protein|nr:ParA family partition ATPase [Polyangiaceae bacterium]
MIVTLMGQKGGVGKSTTAICLGMAAFQRGHGTLLVDADPQGTLRTWSEVAAENQQAAPTVVAMGASMHRPGQLDVIAKNYEYTFIDCPPRHGEVQRSALMISDLAILPCGPSASDVWALTSSLELVESARSLRESLRACIVITRKQPRTSLGRDARSVLESSGLTVLSSELLYRVAYQEALAAGTGVTGRRRDAAASEVQRLFEEVEKLVYAEKKSGCYPAQALASA